MVQRLQIASAVVALLLISACMTLTYLAFLHHDVLPVPAANVASTKSTRLVPRGGGANNSTGGFLGIQERIRRSLNSSSSWLVRKDPCEGLGLSDKERSCKVWAEAGECAANPEYMLQSCELSCHNCKRGVVASGRSEWDSCKDQSNYCGQWAAVGECDSNPHYMKSMCRVTCHLCQSRSCHDVDAARCKAEAAAGNCSRQPERMYKECRWACRWCGMSTNSHCLRDKDQRPAAVAGTVERMFARASGAEHVRFTPRVLSRSPWVVAFDDFLSDEECEAVIRVGGRHFERSVAGDGVQAVRTSSTSWCSPGPCQNDPTMMAVRERIANLTMVPAHNAEHLQVLRYEKGQFYKVHHDQNSPRTSAWGPRIYTFFMYLNDVEEGGHTSFPRLNISVRPKRGAALLWPSVLDDDPNERDDRTEHESVAVVAGTKFAANYWLHMYDFQQPTHRGCGNSEIFGNW